MAQSAPHLPQMATFLKKNRALVAGNGDPALLADVGTLCVPLRVSTRKRFDTVWFSNTFLVFANHLALGTENLQASCSLISWSINFARLSLFHRVQVLG